MKSWNLLSWLGSWLHPVLAAGASLIAAWGLAHILSIHLLPLEKIPRTLAVPFELALPTSVRFIVLRLW
ncbi:MAG: hypothetical protein D6E12_04120 [Desulfovibrio sp.]|nr:MAG: hypothetical protein D6E12_04120 [Desulfovibrio sp.]